MLAVLYIDGILTVWSIMSRASCKTLNGVLQKASSLDLDSTSYKNQDTGLWYRQGFEIGDLDIGKFLYLVVGLDTD